MQLQDLGHRIRIRREKLGLKQTDIAHALQISPQAVSKWERAENGPDITILSDLARILGVSTDWLLGLHAEEKDVFQATVFASSVFGAYKKSSGMQPRSFALWANGLFYTLTETVLRHDAVPIKYMGDQFLCFFSGSKHNQRALQAAHLAREMVSENLVVGLSAGEIFLGSVGHPDYAHPDIMGEIVNLAFLTMDWAESNTRSKIAATEKTLSDTKPPYTIGKTEAVRFKGIHKPVHVNEIVFK